MKKQLFVLDLIIVILVIILALFLIQDLRKTANFSFVLKPEEVAVRHAKGMTVAGFRVDPNTVHAIQKVEINDLFLVLVQYSGQQNGGDIELCEMILEVEKKLLEGWEAKSGSGLCHEVNDPDNTVPLSIVSSYGTTTLLSGGYSTAFGYLRNEIISKVVVSWDDGLVEPASVSERTYLTERDGGYHVERIEAYDDIGALIFTTTYPNPEESNP